MENLAIAYRPPLQAPNGEGIITGSAHYRPLSNFVGRVLELYLRSGAGKRKIEKLTRAYLRIGEEPLIMHQVEGLSLFGTNGGARLDRLVAGRNPSVGGLYG